MFRYSIQRGQEAATEDSAVRATSASSVVDALRLFVSDELVERLGAGEGLAGQERLASVLFVDLRGYASFAESRSPREIYTFLSTYTRLVGEIVHRRGGLVLDLNGDGVMAVFGALTRLPQHEAAAVSAALDLLDAMHALRLRVAIGVATGPTFVGCLPSNDRVIPCAVGNATILASRLEILCRSLDASIVIDEATMRGAPSLCRGFVRQAAAQIRGRRRREVIYVLPAHRQGPPPTARLDPMERPAPSPDAVSRV